MLLRNIDAYRIWAPDNVLWTEWAKPVAFMNIHAAVPDGLELPELKWISQAHPSTAVIVDLPGKDGVLEGLALARKGYRPVPLYNGVSYNDASKMIVPVQEIEKALYAGADELLPGLRISPDAPPAFLLDSNRMTGRAAPGRYDNRWTVFPQDMPSAAYLISKGIRNVIVRVAKAESGSENISYNTSGLPFLSSSKIQSDLEYVLYKYQSLGIAIYKTDGISHEQITVSKPSKLKSWFYRLSVIMGLTRNLAGGFGGIVPEPSRGG